MLEKLQRSRYLQALLFPFLVVSVFFLVSMWVISTLVSFAVKRDEDEWRDE